METTVPIGPSLWQIVVGVLMLLVLAGVVYAIGALIAAQLRRGRIAEETDITYPAVPQSEADRRAVEQVHAREERVALQPDNAADASLHEQAVGSDVRPVRQSPSHAERPADATERRGVAPVAPPTGTTDRNPL
jgi:Na+-transporting methylmalonyl-CoA/oxaloacetate decarboxylase gamma subunit